MQSLIDRSAPTTDSLLHFDASTIHDYYANQLPQEAALSIRNHLVGCTQCRRTVLQMQSIARLLRRLEGQPGFDGETIQ